MKSLSQITNLKVLSWIIFTFTQSMVVTQGPYFKLFFYSNLKQLFYNTLRFLVRNDIREKRSHISSSDCSILSFRFSIKQSIIATHIRRGH